MCIARKLSPSDEALGAKIRIWDSRVYKTKLNGSTYLNENMVGNIV